LIEIEIDNRKSQTQSKIKNQKSTIDIVSARR